MAMTFLSLSFTNTQEAPFSLMQVEAQALCEALAPFAPQELSLIQPVQLIDLVSATVARLIVANSTASKPNAVIALFMFTSSSELHRAGRLRYCGARLGA